MTAIVTVIGGRKAGKAVCEGILAVRGERAQRTVRRRQRTVRRRLVVYIGIAILDRREVVVYLMCPVIVVMRVGKVQIVAVLAVLFVADWQLRFDLRVRGAAIENVVESVIVFAVHRCGGCIVKHLYDDVLATGTAYLKIRERISFNEMENSDRFGKIYSITKRVLSANFECMFLFELFVFHFL